MTRVLPLAVLGGCLFLSEPPPGADPSPECTDTGCDGFTCDTFLDACALTCDSVQPCASGFSCEDGDCVEDCDEDDCDDNLGCDPVRNACFEDCNGNEQCASGFACCTTTKRNNGKCEDVGTCF